VDDRAFRLHCSWLWRSSDGVVFLFDYNTQLIPSKRYGNTVEGRDAIFRHIWFAEVEWEMLRAKQIPAPYIPDLKGAGDTSQFEQYAENDTSEYGAVGLDPYYDQFADFD